MKLDFTKKQLKDLSVAVNVELQSASNWERKSKGEYAKIKRLERIDGKISAALYSKWSETMNKKKFFFTMVNFIFTLIGAIFFGFVILHEVAHIAFLGLPSGICFGNCQSYFSGTFYDMPRVCNAQYCGEIMPLVIGIAASVIGVGFVIGYYLKIFLPNFNID